MLHNFNFVSLLGILAALPAIILTIRVLAKLLISCIFYKEKSQLLIIQKMVKSSRQSFISRKMMICLTY
ncbi:Uncharacterised protein [Klebsiella michiganensis]|uniref:Uncharacterized protein n=1 Tax=Klebsiella michiganensis TaxID=1134687 RepID=A0A7H4LY96_9ENTR|nr:Uncharacterised protein [Klebsiella michiganensis]